MKRALKWLGFLLGGVLGLLLAAVLVGYALGSTRLSRTYDIAPEPVPVPGDEASIKRGRHLAEILCADCHGSDFGGRVVFEDSALGRVSAGNLTGHEGGGGEQMSAAELGLAIRHGVDHDGRGLVVMPSAGYFYMSDEDLGALLAFLEHAAPVDKEPEKTEFTFMGRVIIGLGLFGNLSAAAVIDHEAERPGVPTPGATREYGQYWARIGGCQDCHGQQLNGGTSPNPESPPAPNLTPGGHLAEWSEEDFFTAMRTGVEPDGDEMAGEFMPWEGIGRMTDDELRALWLYLQSLPALPDAVEE